MLQPGFRSRWFSHWWLGLAPKDDISGEVLGSYALKTRNRAGHASHRGLAAASVIRADCALGAFYRRIKTA